MVPIVDAKTIITEWLEKNVIVKIPGEGKRVLMAVLANRFLQNAEKVIDAIQSNPWVVATGIISNGCIDESILPEIREQLKAGKLELPIPMLGTISFDGAAIDSLYADLLARS